uniref:Uncharacterized protein n=1 Tax=Anguilla anguilla TaxID=7936 RepID=A0A0E9RX30_ANGAN
MQNRYLCKLSVCLKLKCNIFWVWNLSIEHNVDFLHHPSVLYNHYRV